MSDTRTSFPETSDRLQNGKVTARSADQRPSPKSAKNLKRFRKDNPRIDYYPSEEAEAAIAAVHKVNAGHGVSRIIDYLVLKGFKARSGNTQG